MTDRTAAAFVAEMWPSEYRAWLIKQTQWALEMAEKYIGTPETIAMSKHKYYSRLWLLYQNALTFYEESVKPDGPRDYLRDAVADGDGIII